jgi:hypothetical protein
MSNWRQEAKLHRNINWFEFDKADCEFGTIFAALAQGERIMPMPDDRLPSPWYNGRPYEPPPLATIFFGVEKDG